MENNIQLKKATIADIPTIISIEESVSGSKLYSPMLTEGEWLEALKRNTTYLIEKDGEIVGEISYEFKGPSHAYIDGLAMNPKFQGKGIARFAMQLVLEELKDMSRVDLVTHPLNEKAINLYKSFGFVIESQVENYFGDGEPRIVLAKIK